MRPPAGQVCHSLMVVSNCTPGSAQAQAASAISRHSWRARTRAHHPAVGAGGEVPVAVVEHRPDELVADPHRVVGVLAGDGLVGLAVEVGGVAGGDEGPDLLLLALLPVDELLDVGMVDVEDDHLGGPPGGASRLDGAGRPVADLQEGHHPGGAAPAGEGLVLGADPREVGARPRAELEEAGLPHPEVHDPALVDQVVLDGLDEAGVRGGPGVGVGGGDGAPGGRVHVPEALGRAGQPVGVVEPGVEPLRAVGGGHLVDQHVGQLVLEGTGVGLGGEVAVALAPPAPGGGEAADDLAGGALRARARSAPRRRGWARPTRRTGGLPPCAGTWRP